MKKLIAKIIALMLIALLIIQQSALAMKVEQPGRARGPSYTTTNYIGDLANYTYDSKGNEITHMDYIKLNGQTIAEISDGGIQYIYNDHLGSPNIKDRPVCMQYTCQNPSKPMQIIEYKPFGEVMYTNAPTPGKSEQSFTGKILDTDTGLIYFGSRYYSPVLGRFITPDTVVQDSNPQNLNRYSYAANNPINRIDFNGHNWFKKLVAKTSGYFGFSGTLFNDAVSGDWSHIGQQIEGAAINTGMALLTAGVGLYATSWIQMAIGDGLIGGIGAAISGGNFGTGFVVGAIGGTVSYAGADIAAQKFPGAGLVGNIVNSGGQSMIESASSNQAWDSHYEIYFGPLSLNLASGQGATVGISSLSNVYYFAQGVRDPNAKLNWGKSLSAGTTVFDSVGNRAAALHGPYGRTMGNNIYLGTDSNMDKVNASGFMQNVFGHEREHAIIQGRMGGGTIFGTDAVNFLAQSTKTYNAGTPGELKGATAAAWQFEKNAQQHDLWQ